jgi:hypothetical protein
VRVHEELLAGGVELSYPALTAFLAGAACWLQCSRRAGGKYVTWQEEQPVPRRDRFVTMLVPKTFCFVPVAGPQLSFSDRFRWGG